MGHHSLVSRPSILKTKGHDIIMNVVFVESGGNIGI